VEHYLKDPIITSFVIETNLSNLFCSQFTTLHKFHTQHRSYSRSYNGTYIIVFLYSNGSTVVNVSTGFNGTQVLESCNSYVAIRDCILNSAIPRLRNATLNVNGSVGQANATYLAKTTSSEVTFTSMMI